MEPSDPARSMETPCGLALEPPKVVGVSATGEPGTEREPDKPDRVPLPLPYPDEGECWWVLDERRRRLSMSSKTMPVSKSAGSSRLALLMVRVLN